MTRSFSGGGGLPPPHPFMARRLQNTNIFLAIRPSGIAGPRLESFLESFLPPILALRTEELSEEIIENSLTSDLGTFPKRIRFQWISTPFWPKSGSKWLHFDSFLAPFLAPLRGTILSENTWGTNVSIVLECGKGLVLELF